MIDIENKNSNILNITKPDNQLKTHEKKVEVVKVIFLGEFKLSDYIHSKMLQELNS